MRATSDEIFPKIVLLGIRIVKYYAWEEAFFDNIDRFREDELKGLRSLANVRALLINLVQSAITIASGLTVVSNSLYFGVYGANLFPDLIFPLRRVESVNLVHAVVNLLAHSSSVYYVAHHHFIRASIRQLVQKNSNLLIEP
jgi:hypothetical protein